MSNTRRARPDVRTDDMLILKRKTEESIIIHHNIEVKVLKVQGGQVHLGIDAPPSVSVHRDEIYVKEVGGVPGQREAGVGPARHHADTHESPRAPSEPR